MDRQEHINTRTSSFQVPFDIVRLAIRHFPPTARLFTVFYYAARDRYGFMGYEAEKDGVSEAMGVTTQELDRAVEWMVQNDILLTFEGRIIIRPGSDWNKRIQDQARQNKWSMESGEVVE